MKILFIENHSIFAQQVINCFLQAHQVKVVPRLSEARVSLAQERFDVVLVDYDLDDGKGEELVRELRQAGNRIKLIGVSARTDGNESLLNAGVDAFCSKMDFARIQELI